MRLPPARWAELVSAHQQSGLSTERFAARHNVNAKTLGWWRLRLRREATTPAFVEVQVPQLQVPQLRQGPLASGPVTLAVPPALRVELTTSPVCIEVPTGADLAWLRAVVRALS